MTADQSLKDSGAGGPPEPYRVVTEIDPILIPIIDRTIAGFEISIVSLNVQSKVADFHVDMLDETLQPVWQLSIHLEGKEFDDLGINVPYLIAIAASKHKVKIKK